MSANRPCIAPATIRHTLWPEDHSLRVASISVVAIATAACSATLLLRSLRDGALYVAKATGDRVFVGLAFPCRIFADGLEINCVRGAASIR